MSGERAQPLTLPIPEALVEYIVEQAAALVERRVLARDPALAVRAGGWGRYLTVREAAEYLRAKPQRVYDLLSSRRLSRHKDGRRVLVSRAELDAYLAGDGSPSVAPALPRPPQSRTGSGLRK